MSQKCGKAITADQLEDEDAIEKLQRKSIAMESPRSKRDGEGEDIVYAPRRLTAQLAELREESRASKAALEDVDVEKQKHDEPSS